MKGSVLILSLCLCTASMADDDVATTAAPTPSATASPKIVAMPDVVTSGANASPQPSNAMPSTNGDAEAARFVTDAKWEIAGYNNEEIIYTILVTSHDKRIIRCTTELKGSYFENGKKLSIADRQSSTVFPDQQVQVGNWMGMDEKSGATYSVKCHPV